MSETTPLVTTSRDAFVDALADAIYPPRDDKPHLLSVFVLAHRVADALLASGVVRAVDGLAEDEALVERVGLALRRSRLTWGTHADRWTDADWQREFWNEAALRALAAALATPTDPSEA